MKYLRKFNEAIDNERFGINLQNFCNDHLAYLIDKGFSVVIQDGNTPKCKCKVIFIEKESQAIASDFHWKEVEDDFIPFYTLLKTKYELLPFTDRNRADKTILLYDKNGGNPIADSDIGNLNLFYDKLYYIKLLVKI